MRHSELVFINFTVYASIVHFKTKVFLGLTIGTCLFLMNTSYLAKKPRHQWLLAHRGVHQNYHRDNLDRNTCTASRILPPTHRHLENTLESIEAAFAYGADMVEIDIHPTTDGQFAVFHDWRLECRSDGMGVVREQTMTYLKTLDIGYGYTPDGAHTFPFRNKGRGLMPSLREVFDSFPQKKFLINFKSNDPQEAEKLVPLIAEMRPNYKASLIVYGGEKPTQRAQQTLSGLRGFTKSSLKTCLKRYLALGWSSYLPQSCRNTMLVVPSNFRSYLWGWPNRFIARMAAVNTLVLVSGPYESGHGGAGGINDIESLNALGDGYQGGVWTDRIEVIGPKLRKKDAKIEKEPSF